MTVQLRPAGSADLPAVARITREAYAIYVERIGREPAPAAADHAALVAAGEVTVATVGALVAHAETLAAGAGLEAVELYTNQDMTENLRLYPRLGYVETGRRSEDGYRRVYFRKALAPSG